MPALDSPQPATTTAVRHAFGNVLSVLILLLIGVLAFSIRLFSVIKYESVIHEFDPYFNYRVTQFLSKNGIYEFWNWFDDRTWYPLGRVIGGTVYPGLRNVRRNSDLWLCQILIIMVPSYISRSVAGSYDNEAVAIFALIFTFYLYIKTLNTGSLFYATLNALAYFYMVCSWGGYTFIINLIPMHVLLCIVTGRYSPRLYIAYAPLSMLVLKPSSTDLKKPSEHIDQSHIGMAGENVNSENESTKKDHSTLREKTLLDDLDPSACQALHELISLVHDHVNAVDTSKGRQYTSSSCSDPATESEKSKILVNALSCSEDDRVAHILWNLEASRLQDVLLAMARCFPRTLEALILHMLSPIAAEVLTQKFDEIYQQTTEEDRFVLKDCCCCGQTKLS